MLPCFPICLVPTKGNITSTIKKPYHPGPLLPTDIPSTTLPLNMILCMCWTPTLECWWILYFTETTSPCLFCNRHNRKSIMPSMYPTISCPSIFAYYLSAITVYGSGDMPYYQEFGIVSKSVFKNLLRRADPLDVSNFNSLVESAADGVKEKYLCFPQPGWGLRFRLVTLDRYTELERNTSLCPHEVNGVRLLTGAKETPPVNLVAR